MIVTETMLEACKKMDEEAKLESPTKWKYTVANKILNP